jgi:hypothetical protein
LTVAAAAAAVLVIGVFVALTSNAAMRSPTPPQADAYALTMTPVKPIPLSATVSLSGHDWGARIEMNCTYGVGPPDTDHDGDGSTSIPMDQIASVQIISADAGRCAVTAKPLI